MNPSAYTRPNKPRQMAVNNRQDVEPLKVEKIQVRTVHKSTKCFTTPEAIIEIMVDRMNIDNLTRSPSDKLKRPFITTVLEPSAGPGAIVDYLIKNIEGITVDCVEINSTLRDILTKKGHRVVSDDFLSWDMDKTIKYDCIMMNPPFSNLQDTYHVMKAYRHLNPQGVLVAIMSPRPFFGSCRRSIAFREWLESVGGYHEDLPPRSFAASGTQVNSKLVIIERGDQ